MRIVVVLIAVLVGLPLAAQSEVNPRQAFYKGREHFDKGEFAQAVAAYKRALTAGRSKALHFNLGTAALFAGQDGEALYHLKLAEKLAPRDEDIQKNIAVARSRAKDAVSGSSRTRFVSALLYIHEKTTVTEALWLFTVLYIAGMGMLHMRLLRPGRWWLRLAVILLVLAGALGYSVITRAFEEGPTAGVILASEADVFSGPSDHAYAVFFKLHAAAEVDVLEVKNGWVKIAVDDKKGFVPANQIGLL